MARSVDNIGDIPKSELVIGERTEGMLTPYRVLDLADEKGVFCGKLLADMGADVVKVERPGGDPARRIWPFYHDEVNPEKSLFWWAFNTSKRGITVDIESRHGQQVFKNLVKTADIVIESFPPGYMENFGLGYRSLEKVNPAIVMVSITPFGQSGPYKDYKGHDIVTWAMGGQMYPWGDADRAPVHMSHHFQGYLHAGAEAATGAMIALRHRKMTGEGQHVDVSIQEAVVQIAFMVIEPWEMTGTVTRRGPGYFPVINPRINVRRLWPCKDGHVMWWYFGGELHHFDSPFVTWMESEGWADDFLKSVVWNTFDWRSTTQETVDRLERAPAGFIMSHTKAELMEDAVRRRVMLYPVSTARDIVENAQLAARRFWVKLEHPELGTSVTYPGTLWKSSEAPPRPLRRAPLIGEHNEEVIGIQPQESSSPPPATRVKIGSTIAVKKPLDGVKVADFGRYITGGLTTKTLCAYGAQVIRIESTIKVDGHRMGPYKDDVAGVNRGGFFNKDNAGRLSVTIDLTNPKGIALAKRLVAWADVAVENYAGGVMERMGLGYDELRKVKPGIIMVSSCMQGQTGPYRGYAGFGQHLAALSGFCHVTGWPDKDPLQLGPYTDYLGPHFNSLAILAALDYRERTGKGQYIDMSQFENGVHFLAPLVLDYAVNGRVADRTGNRCPDAAPHGAFRCSGEDRWCAIAVSTEAEWHSFCQVVGSPEWTRDPKFRTFSARKENEDELERLVENWTINHSAEEIMTSMQTAEVAAGVLQTAEDLLYRDVQLRYRDFFWELEHPEVGKYHTPGSCFRLPRCKYELQAAPLLGQHNEYVLKEILRMSDEDIARLVMDNVIQ